jgi:spore coat protein U-like protein
MKTAFAVFLLFAACALAQPKLSLVPPTAPTQPGTPAVVQVVLSGNEADGAGAAALDFGLIVPAGTSITVASALPSKTMACLPDASKCILSGADPLNLNTLVIPNGVVATATLTVTGGPITVGFAPNYVHAATPIGNELPLTSGIGITVTPASPCDLNGDGIVDGKDVVAFGPSAASCSADLNGNGVCDSVDRERLIAAALGGACKTGK